MTFLSETLTEKSNVDIKITTVGDSTTRLFNKREVQDSLKTPSLPPIKEPSSQNRARIVGNNYKYTTKNKLHSDEFKLFRQSSSNFFQKFKLKKSVKISKHEQLRLAMEARCRALKAKNGRSKSHFSLTRKESEAFFDWFVERMTKYGDRSTEIGIQYVIDDFIATGVFATRAEAFEFLRFVDKDRNGSVSVEEFTNVFCDIENPEHIYIMKNFIRELVNRSDESKSGVDVSSNSFRRSLSRRRTCLDDDSTTIVLPKRSVSFRL